MHPAQLQTARAALSKVQDGAALGAADKQALQALSIWLSTKAGLPATDDSDVGEDDEDEETAGLVAAFKSGGSISGSEHLERYLKLHPQGNQSQRVSLGAERISDGMANGISLSQDPEVLAELEQLGSWEFNVFVMAAKTNGRPLETVGMAAMQYLGLVDELQLPLGPLRCFLRAVERAYHSNPYHCSTHAADVVQTVTAIVSMDNLKDQLTALELLALLVAAIIHDVGHQGVSNDFLAKTASEWALTYNDLSVNENYHASRGWRILLQAGHNFLDHLDKDSCGFLRSMIVELVLATDMKHHAAQIAELKQDITLFGTELTQWGAAQRAHLLASILHSADIANCVKPLPQSTEWAKRVSEEFWLQGDRERELGLPLSPLNDRTTANVPRSQRVFLELFGKPCYEALGRIATNTGRTVLAQYEVNLRHWDQLIQQGITML